MQARTIGARELATAYSHGSLLNFQDGIPSLFQVKYTFLEFEMERRIFRVRVWKATIPKTA